MGHILYIIGAGTIFSKHKKLNCAVKSIKKLEKQFPQYTFFITALDGNWFKGDTPAERYYINL